MWNIDKLQSNRFGSQYIKTKHKIINDQNWHVCTSIGFSIKLWTNSNQIPYFFYYGIILYELGLIRCENLSSLETLYCTCQFHSNFQVINN